MGIALAVALVVWTCAHAWLAVGLGRRHWGRALLALVVPPLAPWWGWRAGLRAPAVTWGIALALYAAGVAVTGR